MRQTVLEEIENMSVARSIKESARLRLGDFELANFNIMMPKDDDLCVVSSENNENLEQTPVSRQSPDQFIKLDDVRKLKLNAFIDNKLSRAPSQMKTKSTSSNSTSVEPPLIFGTGD